MRKTTPISRIEAVAAGKFIFGINIHLNKWDLEESRSSNYYFRFNNIIGFICFLYLIIF